LGSFVPNNGLTNIKNISDIYYPRNWDNFHNKTNSILVENGPTRVFFEEIKMRYITKY